MGEKFEFELNLDLPNEIIEDMENQMLNEVQKRFGADKSGDDIEHYNYIFRAQVIMKD